MNPSHVGVTVERPGREPVKFIGDPDAILGYVLMEMRRDDAGVAERSDTADVTPGIKAMSDDDIGEKLIAAIRRASEHSMPFTKSGHLGKSLHERREELPPGPREIGRDRRIEIVNRLIESGEIVSCSIGKTTGWLDVPGGTLTKSPDAESPIETTSSEWARPAWAIGDSATPPAENTPAATSHLSHGDAP